jgi:HEAT repeat protein
MKTAIFLSLAVLAAAASAWAGVDALRWNAARNKFLKEYRDPAKTVNAVKELAALDDERAVELLCEKTLFHEKWSVRKATFDALVLIKDTKATEYLAEEVRRETDPAKRLVYVKFLKHLTGEPVVRNVRRALQDKKWEIVVTALDAASVLKERALIPDLQKLLGSPNLRVSFEASQVLSILGEKVPDRFQLGPRTSLFPDRIMSDKVIFLLDTSEDMNTRMAIPREDMEEILKKEAQQKEKEQPKVPRKEQKEPTKEDEKTKKEREEKEYVEKFVRARLSFATEKLAKAVKSLESETKANIISFGVTTNRWLKGAEKISKRDYEKLDAFLRLRTTPARDANSALKVAFAEEGVDTIYLITCGLPEGAAVEDTDKILYWVNEENFTRCIKIHTVLVLSNYDAKDLSEDALVRYKKRVEEVKNFLKELSEQNQGTFFFIDTVGKVEAAPVSAPVEKEPAPEKKPEEKKE